MYPLEIKGARTVLREFRAVDVDDALAVIGDHRVTATLPFESRTREQTAATVRNAIESARARPRSEYDLAVALPGNDRVVGLVQIRLGGMRAGRLTCAIRADRWRRGYASDACAALIAFAFEELGLYRISAAVGPDDEATLAAVEQLGFSYEGRIRNHVYTNGAWRDSLLYSVLEPEWKSRPGLL